jgi:hypothetical protein
MYSYINKNTTKIRKQWKNTGFRDRNLRLSLSFFSYTAVVFLLVSIFYPRSL